MKASELRIGNWVSHRWVDRHGINRKYIQVEGYFQNFISVDSNRLPEYETIMERDITPIPLTEEWLIKFGFRKPAHSWIGDKFHLSEWDDYPLNWCVALNKNNAILVEKLKYVHQLQNLYFALTGQELQIKEE